jgi:hypothetical protein
MYWKRRYGGKVVDIDLHQVEEGHCTAINKRGYRFLDDSGFYRPVGDELDANYSLASIGRHFGIERFLE